MDPESDMGVHRAVETVGPNVIEPKVISATAGAGVAGVISGFILWAIDGMFWGGEDQVPDVPLPVAQVILTLVPPALTFVAGYYTRHVNRYPR